jgi:hypothetical protein
LIYIPIKWEEEIIIFPLSIGSFKEWIKYMIESIHLIDDPEELQEDIIDYRDTRIRDNSR